MSGAPILLPRCKLSFLFAASHITFASSLSQLTMTAFRSIGFVLRMRAISTFSFAVSRSILLVSAVKICITSFFHMYSNGLSESGLLLGLLKTLKLSFHPRIANMICHRYAWPGCHRVCGHGAHCLFILECLSEFVASCNTVIWLQEILERSKVSFLYALSHCLMFVRFSDVHKQTCFVAFTNSSPWIQIGMVPRASIYIKFHGI